MISLPREKEFVRAESGVPYGEFSRSSPHRASPGRFAQVAKIWDTDSAVTKLQKHFQDYASYHQTRGNQLTHMIGVPLIVISILAWSARWVFVPAVAGGELPGSLLQLDFGLILIALVSLWYAILNWKAALSFAPVLIAAYWFGRALGSELVCSFFVVGWILQLVGHGVYEKKSPAFTKNLQHLLIGPLWVFVKVFRLRLL